MKIAIVGTRGIPARYGGFETFAENLSSRLADRGHSVRVYCRRAFTSPGDQWDSRVQRVVLPSLNHKYFDTLVHGLFSVVHLSFSGADVVLICNVANSLTAWIPRVFGKPTVLNIDGLDRKRKKWNAFARAFLSICEALSVFTPTRVLTDSSFTEAYYRGRYGKSPVVIGYGAEMPAHIAGSFTPGLQDGRYFLFVSRLEPENNPELVLRAYARLETDWPLVMVGGNAYDAAYVDSLRRLADPRVIFTGPVYGEGYWKLQQHAGAFVFACEIGGHHPALIEAMAASNAILYLDNHENREAAGDAGLPFAPEVSELSENMARLLRHPELRAALARRAHQRATALYGWSSIADQYERLLRELLDGRRQTPAFTTTAQR